MLYSVCKLVLHLAGRGFLVARHVSVVEAVNTTLVRQ